MMVWKMIFLFQGFIFRFHVNLPGCIHHYYRYHIMSHFLCNEHIEHLGLVKVGGWIDGALCNIDALGSAPSAKMKPQWGGGETGKQLRYGEDASEIPIPTTFWKYKTRCKSLGFQLPFPQLVFPPYPNTQMYSIFTYIYHVNSGISATFTSTVGLIPDFGVAIFPVPHHHTSPHFSLCRLWHQNLSVVIVGHLPSPCICSLKLPVEENGGLSFRLRVS